VTALAWTGLGIAVVLGLVLSVLPARACCGRHMEPDKISERGLHLREWHHGWLSLCAFIPILAVQYAALAVGADDLIQHLVQLKKPRSRVSLLHTIAAVTWYSFRRRMGWK
jgi:hypothetical protein